MLLLSFVNMQQQQQQQFQQPPPQGVPQQQQFQQPPTLTFRPPLEQDIQHRLQELSPLQGWSQESSIEHTHTHPPITSVGIGE